MLETASRVGDVLTRLAQDGAVSDFSIYFVDDGSTDRTWALIEALALKSSRIHGLKLSRNCGHQKAILAGLLTAPGDAIISLDADLQDDLGAIKDMLEALSAGADVVYGVRHERKSDTVLKRATAHGYYRLLRWMGVELLFDHADYRLLSRPALEALRPFKETNVFLRGLIPLLGFRSAIVYYKRTHRFAGKSKYPLPRMLGLALDGVTSFTAIPLQFITLLGLLISLLSFGFALWAILATAMKLAEVPGWASTVIPLYLLGGVQMLCLGVIGQYLGKIYTEVKSRPRFIIEKIL